MSIKNLWNQNQKPTVSFEFFPAHDEKSMGKLDKVIDKLIVLNPDFVSVTFGAGGSTRDGSYQLSKKLKVEKKQEVLSYVAAYGLNPDTLNTILTKYKDLDIQNILCVRGDKPEDEQFEAQPDSFAHASDFLEFVNGHFDFFTGAAAYPEGHKESKGVDEDLQFLKMKVEKGAQFIITQFCYDNRFFLDFVKKCRETGIHVPIIAGIMPIYSIKMTENLAALCGATITDELRGKLDALPANDKAALEELSVQFTLKLCRELIQQNVQGLHFYTMDKSKIVLEVVQQLKNEGLLS